MTSVGVFDVGLSSTHVVLFPFMSKGHTIPIIHLTRLLLHRGAAVTLISTPANRPFISDSLADTDVSIIVLPFPDNIDGIPPGVESTDKLSSMSLFFSFAAATKLMRPQFESALESLPDISFIVSDGFLGWTLESASKFGIPRLVFYGMSNYAMTVAVEVSQNRFQIEEESENELFSVPNLPWVKLTRNDLEPQFTDRQAKRTPGSDFLMEAISATSKSYGLIVNSFSELEPVYLDHWNQNHKPKAWCLGPFCMEEPSRVNPGPGLKLPWMNWLDQKLERGSFVLYVAFGSQAEISTEQFEQIKIGLEKAEINFLWAVRGHESELGDGFEERVKERGLIVREWVDQQAILGHQSVQGFLSHCGWNSVLEGICAKVPILAWPMMADQHLNARFVTEEIGVGLRVETCDGSVSGFVKWEGLEKMVRELMEGEMGKEVRKKVKEVGDAAWKAVAEGGSSWWALNELITEIRSNKSTILM